jgi:ATP-dependent HslUV protease ATP-binding subunit HslU
MTENDPYLAAKPLTPREIVKELDRYIVGQDAAKRSVAIAVRNRWRRQQLPAELQQEVSPKNILMIGSTGVGKTEIARRLAKLTGAPFIKVEATKYTEVGYYGRDVESMIRELVDNAISIVRIAARENIKTAAEQQTEERLLDLLCPKPTEYEFSVSAISPAGQKRGEDSEDAETVRPAAPLQRTRDKMRQLLLDGALEDRKIEITVEQKAAPIMMGGIGVEQMDVDFQGMLEKIIPTSRTKRQMDITTARKVIFEQECDKLLDTEKINSSAIELAENSGIIFIDEIDKVIASESKSADVSRQGVQRDLLPIVEGTTVNTKQGYIKTDHILFIAAGAFHKHQPSELMPELQGRFPIRVELNDLTKDDFVRILTEPKNSLTRQYAALLETEGTKLSFSTEAVEALAAFADQVNQSTINIGARRLYTILEHLLEELSFEACDLGQSEVKIDAAYVNEKLASVVKDEDLSKYIL